MIDSSGLFARTRRTAGGAGSKPVCTDRLPQPECHRRTRQSDQPAAGGTETVNRSGRFVAYQCYQPDFSLRPGQKAVDALAGQSAKLLNGIPIDEEDFFGRQLAFNMLPLLPDSEGSVREERRIVDEVRKILQDEGLMISASVVQAPVFYGHAQMVNFEALRPLAAEEARDAFAQGEDIVLSEENEFPTQVGDASGMPHLSVGCVRNDYGMPEQVQFWSVADNVRFGGALMAVKSPRNWCRSICTNVRPATTASL